MSPGCTATAFCAMICAAVGNLVHIVNRRSRDLHPVGQRRLMYLQAVIARTAEGRNQTGMNVQNALRISMQSHSPAESSGTPPIPPAQCDSCAAAPVAPRHTASMAFLLALAQHGACAMPDLLRPHQRIRIGTAGNHQRDLRVRQLPRRLTRPRVPANSCRRRIPAPLRLHHSSTPPSAGHDLTQYIRAGLAVRVQQLPAPYPRPPLRHRDRLMPTPMLKVLNMSRSGRCRLPLRSDRKIGSTFTACLLDAGRHALCQHCAECSHRSRRR